MTHQHLNEIAQIHITNAENSLREAFKSLYYAKEFIKLSNKIDTTGNLDTGLESIPPPPDTITLFNV